MAHTDSPLTLADSVNGIPLRIAKALDGSTDVDFVVDANGFVSIQDQSGTWGPDREFDVLTYGAAADGVTDDSSAVQSALNAANTAGGGRVVVTGTVAVGAASWTGLAMSSMTNVVLTGRNRGAELKILATPSQSPSYSGNEAAILMTSAVRCAVVDLRINCNSLDVTSITLDGCSDCIVSGNYIYGSSGSISANGIVSGGCSDCHYLNNTVNGVAGRGMYIGNSNSGQGESDAVITGNRVYDTGATAIGFQGIHSTISNNVCSGTGGSGIALASSSGNTLSDVTVTGNVCRGNAFHGIQADVYDSAYATSVVVSGNTCESNDGSGIYAANVQDWTISGNVCRNNNADGTGSGHGITAEAPFAKRVSISGNICFDDQGTPTQSTGISLNAQDTVLAVEYVTITGNVCYNNKTQGIILGRGTSGTGDFVTINGNVCTGNGSQGIRVNTGFSDVIVANNVSQNNTGNDVQNGVTTSASWLHNSYGTSSGDIKPVVIGAQATGYTTFTNLSTDRTCDANSTTVEELADILGTLIEDLKASDIISA